MGIPAEPNGIPWGPVVFPFDPAGTITFPTVCGGFLWDVPRVHVGVPWVTMGISRVPTVNHTINYFNHSKLRTNVVSRGHILAVEDQYSEPTAYSSTLLYFSTTTREEESCCTSDANRRAEKNQECRSTVVWGLPL